MIFITQKKVGTRIVYYLVATDSAGMVTEKTAYNCQIKTIEEGGKKLIYLLDRNGKIRRDADTFLNNLCSSTKYSTRRQMASALNLFHTFCDIKGFSPKDMTKDKIRMLMNFMLGHSVQSDGDGTKILRHPRTVNTYYGFVKKYITDMHWPDKAFQTKVTYKTETTIGDITIASKHVKDANTLRVDPLRNLTPPMHLNLDQARALVKAAQEAGDDAVCLLIRLQMGYGLRCGEALGLTTEDLKKHKKPNKNEYDYTLILRNRASDANWQHCKTLYQPISPDEYQQETYKNTETGKIPIDKDLYDSLIAYYENSRLSMRTEWKKRMEEETLADTVESPQSTMWKVNHYIFIGKNGRLLSEQTYNNHLKRLYDQIGIPRDQGSKQTNCSHKLRHTFAMILALYGKTKVSAQQLMILMRHHSVVSGAAYFTPTEEEAAEMRKELVSSIMELIPDLGNNSPNTINQ